MEIKRDFIFDPSLVLYLPLYELDGGAFKSKDAHGHLCTVTGALWRPDGRYFDGTDDEIDCGDISEFNSVSALTVEGWFKQTTIDVNADIWVKRVDAVNRIALQTQTNGNMYCYLANAAEMHGSLDYSAVISSGVFFHGVFVFDGSLIGNANRLKMFVDTVSQTLDFGAFTVPATTADLSGASFKLGQFITNDFDGTIGEIRVYSRALTPLEIQHNYLATQWRYR